MKQIIAINSSDVVKRYNDFLSHYMLPSTLDIMKFLYNNPKRLFVVGARPAMGKTALMLSLINEPRDYSVLVFSLENSETQLIKHLENIQEGKSNCKSIFLPIGELQQNFGSHPRLFIIDSTRLKIKQIRSFLEEQQNDAPVKIVFIDYLQLLEDAGQNCLNHLKQLAEEFQVTIIAFSQLKKCINEKPMCKPELDDFLPGSPDISKVDEVYYLVRPGYYDIEQDDWGNCLQEQAKIYCLKETFQAKEMLLKFNKGNSGFNRSDISEIIHNSKDIFISGSISHFKT